MTDDWLENRFLLFEKYCLPSVLKQSCREFKWICLFDKDTLEKYKSKIEQYEQDFDGFIPVFLSQSESLEYVKRFREIVASHVSSHAGEKLITTYLDNDDLLRQDFIETVQDYAKDLSRPSIISFNYGIQYYTGIRIGTRIRYRNNHFLSLVEQVKSDKMPVTVMSISHYYLDKYKINVIDDLVHRDMWVELIHNNNVDNDVKMKTWHRLLDFEDSITEYGVDLKSRNRVLKYLFIFVPRMIGQFFRRLKYRIIKIKWPPYIEAT